MIVGRGVPHADRETHFIAAYHQLDSAHPARYGRDRRACVIGERRWFRRVLEPIHKHTQHYRSSTIPVPADGAEGVAVI